MGDRLQISREVLSHLPSGVVIFNSHGAVLDANPAARTALEQPSPEGLLVEELFGDAEIQQEDGQFIGLARLLVREGLAGLRSLQRQVMSYVTPSGQRRTLGITFFPLIEQQLPSGLICLLTDLTLIRSMEEELQRRRSLSALGEMAAGIAHEFKNALATISGYAQMVYHGLDEADPTRPSELRGHTERILEQVNSLTVVTTEFLTFARPLNVTAEMLDLNQILRNSIEAVERQDFPLVHIRLLSRFPAILGDPVLLSHAFTNLLRNACEAITQSGVGGKVEIRSGASGRDSVRVLIQDDGPGVPEALREKIFIPFFTTKASGSGLGLAMVHKIITAHRGNLLLANAAARQTTFQVRLPRATATVRDAGGEAGYTDVTPENPAERSS